MPTIDHDPRELSRKALKFVAVATGVITIALLVPINMGIRWAVHELPAEIALLLSGLMMGACVGFFLGRWDALRNQRTPGREG